MDKSARLWNRLARRYAASPVKHEDDYREKLRITREYLTPEAEVFELGCGTGSTAIEHAPYVKHIHATDYSSAMIEIARGKAAAANVTNIDFECIGIAAVRKADDSVDVVMAHSILHLLPDVEAVLRKVYAMLGPGGALVTSTVCIGEASLFWRVLLPMLRLLRLAPHIGVFSQAELEAMLTDAGFVIDHSWRPGRNRAAFIVAKKPLRDAEGKRSGS
jgi:2-polyprenyl-3-methyl-5-hydroxy-6-metoxy-1,4-benzoquinol methylase